MVNLAPIETKVYAAALGAGAGVKISEFTLWGLGVFIWDAPGTAKGAEVAIAAVPEPVGGLLSVIITVGLAALGGWLAKHTPRPETQTNPEPEPRRSADAVTPTVLITNTSPEAVSAESAAETFERISAKALATVTPLRSKAAPWEPPTHPEEPAVPASPVA